ncbi:GNAT family N-acetyltransferase [Neorhizobium sp. JUb45]|uniref:GNAT family N-acetyltransferase n=1 Tax=Neorhizobium sp. JUb45 TaxID=2485113 RepID=UPI001043735D|nr:GNAT family N-acetyltransferase [Neorhizobium sp. JUb45]TCQ99165.1 putative acetyltransferase [Neorhizobium sp. JUb45]
MNSQHCIIDLDDPTRPEIAALLQAGEEYGASLYPSESNHFLSIDALKADNVIFVSARDPDQKAIGTAALALFDGWAELKRMWVIPEARGKGISRLLLNDLENRARTAGATCIRLETGVANIEAIGLYNKAGFSLCGPFANYLPDPLSVFMQKSLC